MSLSADRVSFDIADKALLSDVSLAVTPGRVTMLIGPNGAGKSTLLKLLVGELAPRRGRVLLDGVDLARSPAEEIARRRAVLPQQSHLLLPFTVEEVVAFGRHAFREPRSTARALCYEAMDQLGITHLARRLYPSLSGGEQTRTHLARVFAQALGAAGAARYLLLDEPAASLDAQHQHQMCDAVRRFARERGAGVIVTMHDLNLASQYGDDVHVLYAGALVAAGPAAQIVDERHIARWFNVRLVTAALAHDAARRSAATTAAAP